MSEAVQDPGTSAEAVDGPAVVFLVQEKAGLLTVFHVHDIADAVLDDLHFGVEGFCEKALLTGHSLELAHFGIAALIDSPHRDAVFAQCGDQSRQQISLEAVDAEREGFHDKDILIFVDRKTRQEIRLAEDQPAAGGVDDFPAVIPCAAHALREKGRRDPRFLSAGEETDRDPGFSVDEAVSHEVAVKIFHGDDVSVFERAPKRRDLIVIDPEAARFYGAAFSFFQDRGRVYRQVLLACDVVVI